MAGATSLVAWQLRVGQLWCANCVGNGTGGYFSLGSSYGIDLLRWSNMFFVSVLRPVSNGIRRSFTDLWLAIYKVFGLVVSMSVPNIEVPQRLALTVRVNNPSLHLPHYSFVVWCWPIGRYNDCTMSMAWDVVSSHNVTPRDADVGGHRRCLNEILRVVEGVHTLGTAYAAIWDIAIQVAKVHCTSVQAGLRSTIHKFFIPMKNAVCVQGEQKWMQKEMNKHVNEGTREKIQKYS